MTYGEDLRSGVWIRVSDQGNTATITADTDNALGLPLARTLTDAEAGHLSLLAAPHTTYEIFMPRRDRHDPAQDRWSWRPHREHIGLGRDVAAGEQRHADCDADRQVRSDGEQSSAEMCGAVSAGCDGVEQLSW